MLKSLLALCYGTVLALGQDPTAAQPARTVLQIDPAESRVTITVGKAGLFGFAGHAHEVAAAIARGSVTIDAENPARSSVRVEFDAGTLRVTGKDEPPADVPQVQQVMVGDRVLNVARFPIIRFTSRRLSVGGSLAGRADVRLEGDFTLHGQTHPVTVEASAALEPDGRLTAHGSFSFKQSDFGIEPVTAAGGAIRVRDVLDVAFDITARPDRK